jgi:hypothetical protein
VERRAAEEGTWITLEPSGVHVHLDADGRIDIGPEHMRGKKPAELTDADHSQAAKLLEHRRFLEGPPVTQITGQEIPNYGKGNVDKLVADVAERYRKDHGGKVINPELGEVIIDANAVSESIGHGTGPLKSSAFAAVPDIIQHGKVMGQGKGGKTGAMDTWTIGAPITIAGEPYAGMVMVRKDPNGQRFYLHEVRAIKMLQAGRSIHGAAAKQLSGPGAKLGAIDSVLQKIFAVKGPAGK